MGVFFQISSSSPDDFGDLCVARQLEQCCLNLLLFNFCLVNRKKLAFVAWGASRGKSVFKIVLLKQEQNEQMNLMLAAEIG